MNPADFLVLIFKTTMIFKMTTNAQILLKDKELATQLTQEQMTMTVNTSTKESIKTISGSL